MSHRDKVSGVRKLSEKEAALLAEKLHELVKNAAEMIVGRLPIHVYEQEKETSRILQHLSRIMREDQ